MLLRLLVSCGMFCLASRLAECWRRLKVEVSTLSIIGVHSDGCTYSLISKGLIHLVLAVVRHVLE